MKPPTCMQLAFAALLVSLVLTGCVSVSSTKGYYLNTAEQDKNGSTIQMKVDDELSVIVEDGYTWTGGFADPSLFQAVSQGRINTNGRDATITKIQAKRAGNTNFKLEGEPKCRTSTPPCDTASKVVEREVVITE